jgi:hypothetical protein
MTEARYSCSADPDAVAAPAWSLDAAGRGTRGAEWSALRERAQLTRETTGQIVRSTWRPESAGELRDPVEAERACCRFLTVELRVGAGAVALETVFPETAAPDQFPGIG